MKLLRRFWAWVNAPDPFDTINEALAARRQALYDEHEALKDEFITAPSNPYDPWSWRDRGNVFTPLAPSPIMEPMTRSTFVLRSSNVAPDEPFSLPEGAVPLGLTYEGGGRYSLNWLKPIPADSEYGVKALS